MHKLSIQKKQILQKCLFTPLSFIFFFFITLSTNTFYEFITNAYANTSKTELTICAASSLTDAFNELATEFQKQNPVIIHTSYAASSTLLKQIMEAVPVDIFASADQKNMLTALEHNLMVKESVVDFVQNSVVLIVPKESEHIPQNVQDLLDPTYKTIAIAQTDAVPIGRYAKASLEHEKLWEPLKDRMVYASNVRAILAYVTRSEAEAGFVYKTDAAIAKDDVREICTMQGHAPALYPIGIVANSPHREEAQAFINFVTSKEGKAILEKYGFTPQ